MRGVTATALLVIGLAVPALAAPAGSLDRAFGTRGVARIAVHGQTVSASTLLATPGGLVVIGGSGATADHPGALVVSRLNAAGRVDAGFGSGIGTGTSADVPNGAVVEPSGRIVVAASGTPGGSYPFRVELLGFDASGHLDPTFGSGGRVALSRPALATTVLEQPDGTLLVVGGTSSAGGSLTQELWLSRVSADGHELSSRSTPVSGAHDGVSVGAAIRLPDGGVLLAGDAGGPFLAKLRPDGSPDLSYGPGGVHRLHLSKVMIDGIALDGSGRLLIAGAHIGDLGRSVDVPVAALLVRTTLDGIVDRHFAGGGAGAYLDGVSELSAVAPLPGGDVLAAANGSVLRFDSTGSPRLGFGVGGTSPTARSSLTTAGLLLDGGAALLPGDLATAHYGSEMAVVRVLLAGRGIPAPQRGASVVLTPHGSGAALQVPIALRPQPLSQPTAAPVTGYDSSIGDGAFLTPRAAVITLAHRATVTVRGVGAQATVRGAGTAFALRTAHAATAVLDLARPRCGAVTQTRIELDGRFDVAAGRQLIESRTRRATVTVRQRCHGTPRITVGAGRVALRSWRPLPVGVTVGP